MATSQDTEITLGTGKLLVLFFGLVGLCALFFGFGYSLGKKSEAGPVASGPGVSTPANTGSRPTAVKGAESSSAQPAAMTFYKAVEQKDANPQLTPAADPSAAGAAAGESGAPKTQSADGMSSPNPTATIPSSGYFVQVAAVSKEEDADALVDALKKKSYPAFVAAATPTDKLSRVQVGPFGDIKEAEAMRTKLIGDGYNPILKK